MPVMFWEGQPLFIDGAVASQEECCCPVVGDLIECSARHYFPNLTSPDGETLMYFNWIARNSTLTVTGITNNPPWCGGDVKCVDHNGDWVLTGSTNPTARCTMSGALFVSCNNGLASWSVGLSKGTPWLQDNLPRWKVELLHQTQHHSIRAFSSPFNSVDVNGTEVWIRTGTFAGFTFWNEWKGQQCLGGDYVLIVPQEPPPP